MLANKVMVVDTNMVTTKELCSTRHRPNQLSECGEQEREERVREPVSFVFSFAILYAWHASDYLLICAIIHLVEDIFIIFFDASINRKIIIILDTRPRIRKGIILLYRISHKQT